jgi:tetratricopeptide (TPR) repeat protein
MKIRTGMALVCLSVVVLGNSRKTVTPWPPVSPGSSSPRRHGFVPFALLAATTANSDLKAARDRQDLPALDRFIAQYQNAARANPQSADAQYQLALAQSYAAEITMEVHDKRKSEAYAEAGMEPVTRALELNANSAEYHRLHGALCGQVIPANPFLGAMKYGQCAKDEIDKAIALDNKLALAYVSRGVGNYYLPASMGGGLDVALKDFDTAISLNPSLDEAFLWKGVTLRKANRNAEAAQALQQALKLNPNRAWIKQQLEKTPAK